VSVNGSELALELVRHDTDVSEFRAQLPGEFVAAKSIEVRIQCDMPGGLLFGYAEVR
jgi:hypothetical protein